MLSPPWVLVKMRRGSIKLKNVLLLSPITELYMSLFLSSTFKIFSPSKIFLIFLFCLFLSAHKKAL